RDRAIKPTAPGTGVDGPASRPDDGDAVQQLWLPARRERRLGIDLEIGDARVRMIGLLEAVDERATLDGHAPAGRFDPGMRLHAPCRHRQGPGAGRAAPPPARPA